MAAHVYRALKEQFIRADTVSDIAKEAENLKVAIGHAPSFGDLAMDDYFTISKWCRDVGARELDDPDADREVRDELQFILTEMMPRYAKIWVDLGRPTMAEEWRDTIALVHTIVALETDDVDTSPSTIQQREELANTLINRMANEEAAREYARRILAATDYYASGAPFPKEKYSQEGKDG